MESQKNPGSELARILWIVRDVAQNPGVFKALDLAERWSVSKASAHRYVQQARTMGVDIVMVLGSSGRARGYEVRNWSQVRQRVELWLDLEMSRSVIEPQGSLC